MQCLSLSKKFLDPDLNQNHYVLQLNKENEFYIRQYTRLVRNFLTGERTKAV